MALAQINPTEEKQKPSKLEIGLKAAGIGMDLGGLGAKVTDLKQGAKALKLQETRDLLGMSDKPETLFMRMMRNK